MNFMIFYTSLFIDNIFITSLTFHPEGFSDNSLLISENFFSDTSGGLPLLYLSFNPFRPSLSNLFSHLYAQALDLWSSSPDTYATSFLSDITRLTNRILSFTLALNSCLYASSKISIDATTINMREIH